jgi:2Fe-2S type ferredoxin
MVNELGFALGLALTALVVAMHFARGTGWTPGEDIAEAVLDRRAETVPETDFAEPMNRSLGASGGAVAVPEGEGEVGELAEGEDAEEAAADATPGELPEDEVEEFDIDYTRQDETVTVANNETLLEAGEDEGWDLPYACREGQCLSCGGRIEDGDAREYVVHDDQQMLEEAELEDGYVLTCCAYPQEDFTLETSETP